MKLEKQFRDPPRAEDQHAVDGLRGGAVVLMVAAFEAFLRDVFEERVDGLVTRRRPMSFTSLPEGMRIAAVFNPLEHAIRGIPGKPVGTRLSRIPEVQAAAQHVAGATLPGWAFSITGGNADPLTVKRLFGEVGRRDVLRSVRGRFEGLWGTPVPRTFLADKLEWIVKARNEIAHGASVLSWSRQDLKEAERFLRHLPKTLDDELRMHLNRVG